MTAEDRPDLVFAGDRCLYVLFANRIDPVVNRRVLALFHALREQSVQGLVELVPSYRTLMVQFDPLIIDDRCVIRAVQDALDAAPAVQLAPRLVTLPVVYGGTYGPDLDVVAAHAGLSADEVVRRHSSASYDVYFLGFTPGFPFLGGMPPAIATPRHATPRQRVPAGSVGIAGGQTGVYPLSSPGGWNIIGRTPMALYTPWTTEPEPVLLHAGDRVRFEQIAAEAFASLAAEQNRNDSSDDGRLDGA